MEQTDKNDFHSPKIREQMKSDGWKAAPGPSFYKETREMYFNIYMDILGRLALTGRGLVHVDITGLQSFDAAVIATNAILEGIAKPLFSVEELSVT